MQKVDSLAMRAICQELKLFIKESNRRFAKAVVRIPRHFLGFNDNTGTLIFVITHHYCAFELRMVTAAAGMPSQGTLIAIAYITWVLTQAVIEASPSLPDVTRSA